MYVLKTQKKVNSTDMALMVDSTSKVERLEYNEELIVRALINEAKCSEKIAREVAIAASEKLQLLNLPVATTSFIRSVVNMVLLEKGYSEELKSNSAVTIPFYDVTEIIEHANRENGNTSHSPEAINLTIAERVLKEYALANIYNKEAAEAHMKGEIHIHEIRNVK